MPVKPLTFVPVVAALLLQWPAVGGAQESGLQPLPAIRQAAERAVQRELGGTVPGLQLQAVALDPRLRLPACAAALESQAQPPRGLQARVPVRVGCSQGATWSLNVPVEIRREIDVLVLNRAVARGESVGVADVTVQKRVVAGLASPFVGRAEDLKGRLTRRPLAQGTAVTADALSDALLIHRGQDVTLMASAGGIEIKAPGRALADATARQRVRVQNLESLKIVEGVAESDSVVRVSL
jgi:flagella basal body P-ring formation protein FlgA